MHGVDKEEQPGVGGGRVDQAAGQETVPESGSGTAGKTQVLCEAARQNVRCKFNFFGKVSHLVLDMPSLKPWFHVKTKLF